MATIRVQATETYKREKHFTDLVCTLMWHFVHQTNVLFPLKKNFVEIQVYPRGVGVPHMHMKHISNSSLI